MYYGELSAILASFAWATGATFFSLAVVNIGPYRLNFVRLIVAFFLLVFALFFSKGVFFPLSATSHNWFWLSISGTIGLVIGDLCYFGALNYLGVRITMLLFTIAPPTAAISEYFILKDHISYGSIFGMVIVVSGIIIVIFKTEDRRDSKRYSAMGLFLGIMAAIFQGLGLAISRFGIGELNAIEATYIRMFSAASFYALIFLLMFQRLHKFENKKGKKAYLYALLGAFFGPFLGVILSMNAIKFTYTGIAQTLLSTTPITIIPYSVFVFHEKIGLRSIIGTLIAFAGVILLIWLK